MTTLTDALVARAVALAGSRFAHQVGRTKVGRSLAASRVAHRAWRGLQGRYNGALGDHTTVPFVVLAQPRTGSNLLQTELSLRWPQVRCLGEEFGGNARRELGERATEEISARVFAQSDEHAAVGCRLFYDHVSAAEFAAILAVPGMRVVHLRRRNILRRYVSLQIALQTDVWTRGRGHEAPTVDDRAVTIDVDDFMADSVAIAERRASMEQAIADAGVPVLKVWYEDLSHDLDAELRRVASFLGLGAPVFRPDTLLVRQNPERLRDLVRNYAEVQRRLAATSMREFLDLEDAGGRAGEWSPAPQQELLLRAALLPPADAIRNFALWRDGISPDNVDEGSRRLYPLLYRNLGSAGLAPPFDKVMWHHYVQSSARNQMRLRTLQHVLAQLDDVAVPALVLKGAALTVLHYRDRGTRPMSDLDVLVPGELMDRALAALRTDGWDFDPSERERAPEVRRARHAVTLQRGDDELDLHRHVLAARADAALDAELWEASVEMAVGDRRARALGAADQLLHAFAHGLQYNPLPPLRWVADAHVVIASAGRDLDWQRLLDLTSRYRLAAYTSAALEYLDQLFPTIVPAAVLTDSRALQVTRQERREFEHAQRKPHWLEASWYLYRQREPQRSAIGSAIGFLDDLRLAYELDHAWQVPWRAARGVSKRWRARPDGDR